ncbi:MAG: DNA mismatch repair endonuclease MutL [Rhodospirillales bacterium]|nr:DNA mismatch repair endonuclease MutL [Rhodospirillales bacterium]
MTIRLLPETLVNRIAAGEVVERPASVVKELVENSIDAGAQHIDIILRDGGQTLISVTDDGCGMTAEEMTLAVERHATSKLPDDDLIHIRTLGFRGEALPSIGGIARLSIQSRTPDSAEAWKFSVEGGAKSTPEPVSHPVGTRIDVRDLFYATPARLKFLKTPRTEQNHAVEIINRLAMAHPEIGFTLSDGTRHLIRLNPAHDGQQEEQSGLCTARLERLTGIMGRDFADNAMPIEAIREAVRLTGYASLPTLNRGNAAMQFLFVNGRPVRDKLLVGALRGAYRDFLASDRYPMVALFLDVPPDAVDVNVHPAKTEVRFRDAGLVRGLIVGALKHALAETGHRASTSAADAALGAFRAEGSAAAFKSGSPSSSSPAGFGSSPVHPGLAQRAHAFHQPHPSHLPHLNAAPDARMAEDDMGEENYPLGVARAQLHATYVVAQTADGIVIVDQHAAHERLVHERIKNAMESGGVQRQGLLIPEVVELEGPAVDRLIARAEELAEMGLVLEAFGEGAVVVRETPALLGEIDIKGLIRDLADDLAEMDEALSLRNRLGDVCASLACHSSVRAGRKMNALLREMEATPHSGQCSHGRPTYVELKLHDIEKLFGRR